MKPRHKVYIKLNIVSLFFISVSFISITLAWFAYSGLSKVSTEIDVKSWFIEFQKDNQTVSNDIVISLSEIYPGMETVNEVVKINNLGDSNAQISYSIVTARILGDSSDDYVVGGNTTSDYVIDRLSQEYPFNININLSKNYVLSKGSESVFNVSISWPLDSGDDNLDSVWGNKAYQFHLSEIGKLNSDPNYKIRPSVKVVISVKAEQFIETSTSPDIRYNLGDVILYDVVSNSKCSQLSSTCLKTYVLDVNNTLGDGEVKLLPDLYNTYQMGTYTNYNSVLSNITSSWNVPSREFRISDILNVISNDIIDSIIVKENISNSIIGDLKYENRLDNIVNKVIANNARFHFHNDKYSFLSTAKCYWINNNYGSNRAFAFERINTTSSEVYGKPKTETCSVVPVIIVSKTNLN